MTAARPAGGTVAASPSAERGFQPASRRRNRIAAGVALAAIAIGGNLWVYSNLDTSEPVVQAVRDIPAGEQITTDMLRTVDVDVDSTVNVIAGDQLDSLVGSYAKVRLVSGSLVTAEALQPTPLVTPGASVVAIQVADGSLPIGLRERVPVLLVVPADRSAADSVPPRSRDEWSGCRPTRPRRSDCSRCRSRSPRPTPPPSLRPTTSASSSSNRPRIQRSPRAQPRTAGRDHRRRCRRCDDHHHGGDRSGLADGSRRARPRGRPGRRLAGGMARRPGAAIAGDHRRQRRYRRRARSPVRARNGRCHGPSQRLRRPLRGHGRAGPSRSPSRRRGRGRRHSSARRLTDHRAGRRRHPPLRPAAIASASCGRRDRRRTSSGDCIRRCRDGAHRSARRDVEELAHLDATFVLAVIGTSPFDPAEIGAFLDEAVPDTVQHTVSLADDPLTAATLAGRAGVSAKRLRRLPLMRDAARVATQLADIAAAGRPFTAAAGIASEGDSP